MENLASGIKAGAITAMLCFGLLMLSANEVYATGNNNNRPCDRVTGGGYIYTAAGGNGTFAVNFGRNAKNELFVQINFIDHATGLRVKATSISSYTQVGGDTGKRRATGLATNQTTGVTLGYTVIVDDNGEPGNTDTFRITLSNGYTASGTLAGGNIQLHHQCRPSGGPNR
ncbi:MAG TPA: post-COAP-1 domain-containing protein [Gammaproteobacteria bacterium]|nr:post-COAP-1 domain-containing protein [Gammaproteobacteria bacterium]